MQTRKTVVQTSSLVEALMACEASARANPAHPQPRVSLEGASGMLPVRRSRLARVGRNLTVGRSPTFWFSSLILVHKGQPPLGSSTIELLSIVSKHGANSQNRTCSIKFPLAGAPYHAFRNNITCLSLNHTLPKNTTLLTTGRGAPGGTVQAQRSSTACRRTG